MREIDELIVHCSDSEFGDAETLRRWHIDGNKWDDIGYHFVVLNGRRKARGEFREEDDGLIETGRPLDTLGAHCRGRNKTSVGVCLIGKRHFTAKQLLAAIPDILSRVGSARKITIKGHYEYDKGKTCPNIDMELLRGSYSENTSV